MKQLSTTELNELVYRLGTSIKNNTTQEVFFMTKEEAEDLYERLTDELYKRAVEEDQK
jgi:hypothetical protein